MKRVLLLLAIVLIGATLMQAREKQEVVRLKNGQKVRGKIVVYEPLDSLVIQEEDGTQHTFKWNEIMNIRKEKWQPQQSVSMSFTEGIGVQKGYRGFVDAEFYLSIDAMSKSRFGFSTSHGYQVLPYLYVGAGVGMQFITHMANPNASGINLDYKTFVPIPVFADVRLDLYKYKICPFIDVRAGKVFGDKAFGMLLNPSVGCRFHLSNALALNASLGYSMQTTDLWPRYGKFTISHRDEASEHQMWQNNPYHSLSFKLGVEF